MNAEASPDRRLARAVAAALLAAWLTSSAVAQDTVTIASGSGGRMRLTGRIVDYTGGGLQLETPGGQTRNIPAAQVAAIETQYGQWQIDADAAFAQGRWAEALGFYRQAIDAESRAWVRRQIVAQTVRCHRALGEDDRAGEAFLLLIRGDAETPYFDVIPLAWLTRQPSPQVEQAARAWAQRDEPAARLLAASHVLNTAERVAAQGELVQLAAGADTRVAQLATAQTWRSAVNAAGDAQLALWQRAIEQMPDALQAGPYYVLGQAQLQRRSAAAAALCLLRAALGASDDLALRAQSLLDAGRALELAGDARGAAAIYREVLGAFGDDLRSTTDARARLLALGVDDRPTSPSALVVAGRDASADERFLDGLRVRGLMKLAETYCREQLARPELSDVRRAELTVELARSLAEQALAAPPAERELLWVAAQQTTDAFVRQNPQSPRLPLVRLQTGLTLLARGELATQEALLLGSDAARVERARMQIREAIRVLAALATDLETWLRERSLPGRVAPEALTANQLLTLQRHVQHELSRAYRNQAQCYQRGSDDHAHALLQAVKLLGPLASLEASDPLRNRSRVDLVVCYRLLFDMDAAQRAIEAIIQEKPDAAVELRCRAEQVRMALAVGRLADAIGLVSQGRELRGVASAEFDLATVEVCLAGWQAATEAKDSAAAAEWLNRADAAVQTIDRAHGPIWKRRAEMAMEATARAQTGGEDLSMQIRVAENDYRGGRLDEALASYDRARGSAEQRGNAAAVFDLAFTAATIEHQRGRHEAARDRYRQLAIGSPQHAKAAEAHLLAVAHAAELAKTPAAGALESYIALLDEHRGQWKEGPTFDEASKRLGRIREFQRDWPAAVAAYQGVSEGAADYLATVEAIARCYEAWLRQCQTAGDATEPIAAPAARWLESVVLGPRGQWPEHWGPVERHAALASARLWMNYTTAGYGRAQQLLGAALEGAADAPPEWRSAAEMLLVTALAGGGRGEEAAAWLRRAAEGPTEQLIGLLDGLGRLAQGAPPKTRGEIASLQLQAIELLEPRRRELPDDARERVDRVRAQALADAGRGAEALAAFRSLAEAAPRDIVAQEGYARQLAAGGDRAALEGALKTWAQLQKNWADGSEPWLRAQYAMALLQHRLGDRRLAAQRLKFAQRMHPDAGPAELRAEMAELLRQCEP